MLFHNDPSCLRISRSNPTIMLYSLELGDVLRVYLSLIFDNIQLHVCYSYCDIISNSWDSYYYEEVIIISNSLQRARDRLLPCGDERKS